MKKRYRCPFCRQYRAWVGEPTCAFGPDGVFRTPNHQCASFWILKMVATWINKRNYLLEPDYLRIARGLMNPHDGIVLVPIEQKDGEWCLLFRSDDPIRAQIDTALVVGRSVRTATWSDVGSAIRFFKSLLRQDSVLSVQVNDEVQTVIPFLDGIEP